MEVQIAQDLMARIIIPLSIRPLNNEPANHYLVPRLHRRSGGTDIAPAEIESQFVAAKIVRYFHQTNSGHVIFTPRTTAG